ncbi:MAG: hypothetical protein AB8G05_02225 [Oligoflexales bacterium]
MKFPHGSTICTIALALCLILSLDIAHAGFWCSSTGSADKKEILDPDCKSQEQNSLNEAIDEAENYLSFAKEDVHWDEQALSLLARFLKDYRIQESIWLLNRYGQTQLGDKLEASLKHLLLCAPISSKEPQGGGATKTWLLSFNHVDSPDLQIRAIYKPQQANLSSHVGSEVATYLVDRLLQTDIVPLTISRKVDQKKLGSLQYFIKDAKKISDPHLPDMNKHKSAQMYLLDYLTKNIDRGDFYSRRKIKFEYNYLYLPSLDQPIAIDNSWALRGNFLPAKLKRYWVDKRHSYEKSYVFPQDQVPAAAFYTRVKNLNAQILYQTLDGIIAKAAINKILKRRRKVLRAFEAAAHPSLPGG